MAAILNDVLYSVRALRRNPGFTAGAILVLGLGIGASTAIFAVARSLVFRPLPFEAPDRLVAIWKERVQTGMRQGASWPDLADWGRQPQIFEGVAAYMYSDAYLHPADAAGAAERVSEIQVSGEFFPLLGVRPMLGRWFSEAELRPMAQNEGPAPEPVVVGYELWRRRLGGDASVLGRAVRIQAANRIVIGVLPPGFRIFRNERPEVFSPLRAFPGHVWDRSMAYLEVIGRLRSGIDVKRADAEMRAYSRRAAREHADTESGLTYRLESLHEHWFGSRRPIMIVLLGAVALLLVTACAKVSALLLIRGAGREKEIAVRAALGASRSRIARQLLTESLLLGAAGGGAGLLLALWGTDLFSAFSSSADLGLPPIRLDIVACAFTILLSLVSSAAFGLLPSIHSSKLDLGERLKAGGHGSSIGMSAQRMGSAMVVGEIAVSAVLLVGAGLLAESFIRMAKAERGFQTRGVLIMSISRAPFAGDSRRRDYEFWTQLIERSESLPGVEAAAVCGAFPLSGRTAPNNMLVELTADLRQLPAPGFVTAEFQDVSPGYFRVLGVPLRKGRVFEWRDASLAGTPAVINESFAREIWGDEDPVGGRLRASKAVYTVVGVVADVKQHNLRGGPAKRLLYRPLWDVGVAKWPSQYLVVRASSEPLNLMGALRGIIRSLNPDRLVVEASTLEEVAYRSTAWDRLTTGVTGLFGLAASLLAVIGVYAVVSQSVLRRRREIGIRIALGGSPADIRGMVLRKGAALALAGLAIGVFLVRLLARFLESQLFEVSAVNLTTTAAVSLLLFAATLVACYVPACRATRVDPASVLRAE